MKSVGLVAVPPGVVTVILPAPPLAGLRAVNCAPVAVPTAVARPPNATDVPQPVRPLPLMATEVPPVAIAGANPPIVGAMPGGVRTIELDRGPSPTPFTAATAYR